VFSGGVRPVRGDAVDRQQRAVQEQIRLRRRGADGVGQGGCEGGQEVDGLGDLPVGGGGSDAESGRELGIRVAYPQVGEREQGLAAGAQPSPAGTDRTAVPPQLLREETEGGAEHVQPGRADKHVKPLVETVLLVENRSTRGFTTLSAQLPHFRGRLEGFTVPRVSFGAGEAAAPAYLAAETGDPSEAFPSRRSGGN
jgi:hypothetical protein